MTGYRPGTGSFIKAPQVSESAEIQTAARSLGIGWGALLLLVPSPILQLLLILPSACPVRARVGLQSAAGSAARSEDRPWVLPGADAAD